MTAQDNAELVRNAYGAFMKGDIPAVLEAFSPDIAWHIAGRSEIAGEYRGHQDVLGFFGQLHERSGGTFQLEIVDITASDDHVIALTRETGDRNGKVLDITGVHIWQVRDGKATDFQGTATDVHAEDEFWS